MYMKCIYIYMKYIYEKDEKCIQAFMIKEWSYVKYNRFAIDSILCSGYVQLSGIDPAFYFQ